MSRLKNLYHTTCRNLILAEMSTRKMERERYCELIWCSNVTWFISWTLIQNHFPHRCRRVGSTCRSFIQEIAPKVWFWFAKILKRSGSFLGKVFHHYRHVFYRFDRNVIKPSGRAWFRCSVRGCSAKWANYKKNITNIPICSISG